MTPDALVAHYIAVADASPIPVLLYNVPKFTHVDMAATTVARAVPHPNIVGIKDSSGNITKLADTVRLAQAAAGEQPPLTCWPVRRAFSLPRWPWARWAAWWPCPTLPRSSASTSIRSFSAGRWDEAADLQRRMVPVNTAITATLWRGRAQGGAGYAGLLRRAGARAAARPGQGGLPGIATNVDRRGATVRTLYDSASSVDPRSDPGRDRVYPRFEFRTPDPGSLAVQLVV